MDIVKAGPTKSFFVSMLTRDIELRDAILDLLDNCVDGVLRTRRARGGDGSEEKPYEGFWAEVAFDGKHFVIQDNCGGIPRDIAVNYAFVMGRPERRDTDLATVGAYGIGMKRALFKLGERAEVASGTDQGFFRVDIAPEWLRDDVWQLPLEDMGRDWQPRWLSPGESGTRILVQQLLPAVSKAFEEPGFNRDFITYLQTHYSYIIQKGFKVRVNGTEIPPRTTKFLVGGVPRQGSRLAPYVYEGTFGRVRVTLVVGFYRPVAGEDEIEDETAEKRSADTSGWTVVCNDRVVLYNDKTILTGWGEVRVPSFHNQFIGIAGEVHFVSSEPLDLPVTTTKRGIDASSEIYLKVKHYMREGTKQFTDYTNQWKGYKADEAQHSSPATPMGTREVSAYIAKMERPKRTPEGFVYSPNLPRPERAATDAWIRFVRPKSEVKIVSDFLFDDGGSGRKPSEVGEACFDEVLRQAKKERAGS